jgi:hypothetical protein
MSDVIISGRFGWVRDRPYRKGGKFYCSSFSLTFEISKPILPGVNSLFIRLGYKEVTGDNKSPTFVKKVIEGSDVLDEVNTFTSKYLNRRIIDGSSPEGHLTWEFDRSFLKSVMYYKQSLKRYGSKPNE